MSKESLMESVGGVAETVMLSIEQHAPEIGFWGGLACILTGAGLAVYKSLKRAPEIKKEATIQRKELTIKKTYLSEEEAKAEESKITKQEVKDYAKAYSIPFVLVVVGVTAEIFGFLEIEDRYTVAAAEATALATSFAAYRKRTAKIVGEEQEQALYLGKDLKLVDKKVQTEDGNTVTVQEYEVVENGEPAEVPMNPYLYEFSPDTTEWCEPNDDCHDLNLHNIRSVEKEWNHIFKDFDTKVIWLVDILRAMGLEREIRLCSRNAAWLNPKFYKTPGDGEIRIRVTEERYIAWDGQERWRFWLDFNCDGDGYALLKMQGGMMQDIGAKVE